MYANVFFAPVQLSLTVLIAALTFGPAFANAERSDEVTLRFNDGDTIDGVLLGFDGVQYQLSTSVGNLVIPAAGVQCIGDGCPATSRSEHVEQFVTLETLDGLSKFEGKLIEITDSEFAISTSVGDLRVKQDSVVCNGIGCPESAIPEENPTVEIVGPGVNMSGTLVNYTELHFTVRLADLGDVNFSRSQYKCKGQVCPD